MRVWTKKEDELLLEGVQKYSGNWRKIAGIVGTKSPDECMKRANKIKIP